MNLKKFLLLFLLYLIVTANLTGKSPPGKKNKANEEIKILLKKLENLPDGRERISVLSDLAWIYRNSDMAKALGFANRELALSKKIKYIKGIGIAYNTIGVIYVNFGDFSRASENYFKALKIFKEAGDKRNLAISYNNIGVIFKKQGDYSRALEYYFESLKIKEESGNQKMLSKAYNNIGTIYDCMDNYSQALKYHIKSLKIKEITGDKQGIANSFLNIGINYKIQGIYHQALEYFFKSLKMANQLDDKIGITRSYYNIGVVYAKKKAHGQALENLFKSLKLSEESGIKNIIGFSYLGIGKVYKETGEINKAIDYLNRGLIIARALDHQSLIQDITRTLSEAYYQTGQYKNAFIHLKTFKEASDKLKNDANTKKITQLEMQYEFDKKQKQQQAEQEKKDLQKEAELSKQRSLKYTFSGVAILLALVFYTRFRLKVKVNRQLRKEIHDRQHAEAELIKSMKLETVGILSAGIAHDFNNLLAVIEGNLEMAGETLADPVPNPQPFIESAEKATGQAAALVKKFLIISEGGWISLKEASLQVILNEALDSSPELRDVPVSVSLPKDLKPIYGDQRQLRQVMLNLLANAMEATGDIGDKRKIALIARKATLTGDNPEKLDEGEYVMISVKDNGAGIPAGLLPKIFDPYVSTKERCAQKGMGMGLAVSYAIIQRHGGAIAVKSQPGKGSTFDIFIPVRDESKRKNP